MGRPYYSHEGKLLAAGELPIGLRGADERLTGDRPCQGARAPDKRPKRPCACCGRTFQPTLKRRMLCEHCYGKGDILVPAGLHV